MFSPMEGRCDCLLAYLLDAVEPMVGDVRRFSAVRLVYSPSLSSSTINQAGQQGGDYCTCSGDRIPPFLWIISPHRLPKRNFFLIKAGAAFFRRSRKFKAPEQKQQQQGHHTACQGQ